MLTIQQISKYTNFSLYTLLALKLIAPFIQWSSLALAQMNPAFYYYTHQLLHRRVGTPEGTVLWKNLTWSYSLITLGLLTDLLAISPFLISLFILARIFSRYEKNNIFSTENAASYKKLGILAIVHALLVQPVTECLLLAISTINNEPGHRWLAIQFSTLNIEMLILGAVIIVISSVMYEASKLHSEQQLTI